MKTLPAGMQAHLDSGTTTLATCWKITRRDGVVMGFTDHDRTLVFDGVSFDPLSGFTASEMQSDLGLNVDSMDVFGALTSARITEADLMAGAYDNAAVSVYRVNWTDVSQRVILQSGNIGETKRGVAEFTAEVRSLAHVLNQPTGRTFQSHCDAAIGDARCTVDLELPAFKGAGTVSAAPAGRTFTASGLGAFDTDFFARGRVTWLTGANAGQVVEVKSHALTASGAVIELWMPPVQAITSGDTFEVRAGCDKTKKTCKDKFANLINFRGFPDMPGNDFIQAGVDPGAVNNGGSKVGGPGFATSQVP